MAASLDIFHLKYFWNHSNNSDIETPAVVHPRIGHGVDLPFEDDVEGTLKFMLKHGVGVARLLSL